MRFEDWTFRKAEVRLAEHSDLRAALGLERVPDHTTLYRFMRRVTGETLDEVLRAVAQRLVPRRRGRKRQKAVVAVDATGLAPGSVSTFFINRRTDRGEGLPWRHWCKWTVVVNVLRRCVLAQQARPGPYNDCATLQPLVSAAHEVTPVGLVLADAEFDSDAKERANNNYSFDAEVRNERQTEPKRYRKKNVEERRSQVLGSEVDKGRKVNAFASAYSIKPKVW